MPYEARLLGPADESEWERLVDEARGGTLFTRIRWYRLLCRATGGRFELVGCFHDGRLVGGVPLYRASSSHAHPGLLFFDRESPPGPTRPPLTPYQGPIWIDRAVADLSRIERHRHEVLEALHQELVRRYGVVELSAPIALIDPRPWIWAGWQASPRYTYRLDLSSSARLAGGRTHALRKQIGKCEREGVVVEAHASFDELFALWEQTFRRQQVPVPISRRGLEQLLEPLLADGTAELAMARRDGAPLAFNICLHDGETAYDWIAGATAAGLQLGAPSFAKWQQIEGCVGRRAVYDLVGANVPSIARYKAGFGAELATHLWLRWAPARRLAGLDRVRSLLSRFGQQTVEVPVSEVM